MSARVAFFVADFSGGGAERAMLDLAAGMARRGQSVDLVVARATGRFADSSPEGVRLIDLKAFRVEASHLRLLRYLRHERPAALVSTLVDADLVAIAVRKALHGDVKLIVRVANTMSAQPAYLNFKGRVSLALWRRLLPNADAVVAVSIGVAEDLRRYVPSLACPVKTIHGATWPYVAEQAKESPNHPWFEESMPVVLSVGRLVRQKAHETTLRAFAELVKSRPARLVILGEGPLRHDLIDLARSLEIVHLVDFAGFQSNPFAYMARAAVFVLASELEGLPNVLVQALACGTRVVSTDCPSGAREVLEDGRWGELVAIGDWHALAAAISRTLDAPVNREALIARAQAYGGELALDQYAGLLQELIACGPSAVSGH